MVSTMVHTVIQTVFHTNVKGISKIPVNWLERAFYEIILSRKKPERYLVRYLLEKKERNIRRKREIDSYLYKMKHWKNKPENKVVGHKSADLSC